MATGLSFDQIYRYGIVVPWLAFLFYWLIASFKTRTTEKRETSASRYSTMLLMVFGYYCLFARTIPIAILHRRFITLTEPVMLLGGVLTWLGVLLAIWARYHLGENWSARVTIKVGHELIGTGPYSHLRHPIYTGLLLAGLGTAIAVGEVRGLVGVSFMLIALIIKGKKEEAMLTAQFGSAFEEHRRHTGFLLPRFR
ncbi:MAG TPA: isoprenylcysteine carboxylmethyltransferase family protein [Terriglobales bacterium]